MHPHQCFVIVAWMLTAIVSLAPTPAAAQWPAWLWGAETAAGTLDQAIGRLDTLPAAAKSAALAAQASQEGHWTFANASGERFTAGTPDELKRVAAALLPDGAPRSTRLTLLLTEDTVFRQRMAMRDLQQLGSGNPTLMLVVGPDVYPLLRRSDAGTERSRSDRSGTAKAAVDTYYAEARPGLLVELVDRRQFDEAIWQLTHPLKHGSVRVVSLEPGGPQTFSSLPRFDKETQRALTDVLDPAFLQRSLLGLRGQTAIVTARIDGGAMRVRPSSGPEIEIGLKDTIAAAEAADVNLVILQSQTPRQPGTRSWLWQRVSVDKLDSALGRQHLADFLAALGGGQTRFLASVTPSGEGRMSLRAQPLKDDSSPRTGIGEALSDIVSDIAGRVVISGVEASLRSADRQAEIDRRLVPGLPSVVQWGYLAAIALGLLGLGPALAWFAQMWPPEQRETYGAASGWMAARATRLVIFAFVFMPAVAIASAPVALARVLKPGETAQPKPPAGSC